MRKRGSNQYQDKWGLSPDTMASLIIILVFLLFASITGAHYRRWSDKQFEQNLVSPIPEVQAAEPDPPDPYVKAKTDLEVIDGLKHRDVIIWIYGLESTWGEQDGCKRQGRFNGFGYMQNDTKWACFDSFQDVAGLVDRWFDVQLRIKSLPEALCYYNTGKAIKACRYYRDFLTLKGGL